MAESLALFAAGVVLLAAGAEAIVYAACHFLKNASLRCMFPPALLPGLRPAIPVIAVVISATLRGRPEIVLGTVIGVFVANIGLLLGVVALVRPVAARDPRLTIFYGQMIAMYFLTWFLTADSVVNQTDGGVLLAALVGLLVYLVVKSKSEPGEPVSVATRVPPLLLVVLVLAGGAAVWFGGIFLVTATGELAQTWHVREWLVSLTLVGSVITLRGLIDCVVAARRGDANHVFQTVFGGNVLVLLLGLGIRGVLSDKSLGISAGVLRLEIPLMGLFALLILPVLLNGFRTRRRDGIILLGAYVTFVVWEVNRAVK